MARRLTEEHPLTKKLKALEAYMSDQEIKLEWDGYHLVATDTETNQSAYVRDLDDGTDVTEMPYMCETKLIRD